MARPTTRGLTNRVQVEAVSAPPSLGVYAPVNVQTAPPKSAQALASLAQALGVAGQIGAENAKARKEFDIEQGRADEALGQVDAEREARSRNYADGVYEGSVLRQFGGAWQATMDRAAEELDRTLPVDQQVAWLDQQMRTELGELAQDPLARRIMAERYGALVNAFANNAVGEALQRQTQETVDATVEDLRGQLVAGLTPDYADAVGRIYRVTGDRAAAVESVMGAYAGVLLEKAQTVDLANAEEELAAVLAGIPTEIETETGRIPGPLSSPRHAALMAQAQERAAEVVQQRRQAVAEREFLDTAIAFEQRIEAGGRISVEDVRPYFEAGTITREQAVSYVTRSWQEREAGTASAEWGLQWFGLDGGYDPDLLTNQVLPDGTRVTPQFIQQQFDAQFARLAQNGAFASVDADGQMVPMDIGRVIDWSVTHKGRPPSGLRAALNNVNQGTPESVQRNLQHFRRIRELGIEDRWIDRDTAVLYERFEALVATGATPQAAIEELRTTDARAARENIDAVIPEVRRNLESVELRPQTGRFIPFVGEDAVTVADVDNPGVVRVLADQVARAAAGRGAGPQEVQTIVARRLQAEVAVVPVGGRNVAIPRSALRAHGVEAAQIPMLAETLSTRMTQTAELNQLRPEDVRLSFDPLSGNPYFAGPAGERLTVPGPNGEVSTTMNLRTVIQESQAEIHREAVRRTEETALRLREQRLERERRIQAEIESRLRNAPNAAGRR